MASLWLTSDEGGRRIAKEGFQDNSCGQVGHSFGNPNLFYPIGLLLSHVRHREALQLPGERLRFTLLALSKVTSPAAPSTIASKFLQAEKVRSFRDWDPGTSCSPSRAGTAGICPRSLKERRGLWPTGIPKTKRGVA